MDIVALFYDPDRFAVAFEPRWHQRLPEDGRAHRRRASRLCLGEVMTLLVLCHGSGCRTFKEFYLGHVRQHLRGEFPRLPSHNRFVDPSTALRAPHRVRRPVGVPPRAVRRRRRAGVRRPHRPARLPQRADQQPPGHGRALAARGKTSTGWFHGFKLQP